MTSPRPRSTARLRSQASTGVRMQRIPLERVKRESLGVGDPHTLVEFAPLPEGMRRRVRLIQRRIDRLASDKVARLVD